MSDERSRNSRRGFLGRIGLLTLGAAWPAHKPRMAIDREGRVAPTWDMSWVERVASAPYKAVIDSTDLSDGAALDLAADIMHQFHEVYNGPDEQTRVVVVMRRLGAVMAFEDALWNRYAIGEDRHIVDPATKSPARRNPFLRAPASESRDDKIEPLVKRGMTILVCNRAAMNSARSLAEKSKRKVEDVQNEVRNGLVPGAYLMPDGIFALVRAQNAGCALMNPS